MAPFLGWIIVALIPGVTVVTALVPGFDVRHTATPRVTVGRRSLLQATAASTTTSVLPTQNRRLHTMLPFAYKTAAAGLVAKVPFVFPPTPLTMIQLATASIILADFEPTGTKQLKESAEAVSATRDPTSPFASNAKLARKWQRLVQLKLWFEALGAGLLLGVSPFHRLAPIGAGVMLLGHVLFWQFGAGDARVTCKGESLPMPQFLTSTILKADLALAAAAFACAGLPVVGHARARAVSAGLFVAGIAFVIGEKLAGRMSRNAAKTTTSIADSSSECLSTTTGSTNDSAGSTTTSTTAVSGGDGEEEEEETQEAANVVTKKKKQQQQQQQQQQEETEWHNSAKAAQLQRMLNTKTIDGVRGTSLQNTAKTVAKEKADAKLAAVAAQAAAEEEEEAGAKKVGEAGGLKADAAAFQGAEQRRPAAAASASSGITAVASTSRAAAAGDSKPLASNTEAAGAKKALASVAEKKAAAAAAAAAAATASQGVTTMAEKQPNLDLHQQGTTINTTSTTTTSMEVSNDEHSPVPVASTTGWHPGVEEWLVKMGLRNDSQVPQGERLNAMEKIKAAGTAGLAAYALTEGAFWVVSLPLAVGAVAVTQGSLPDLGSSQGQGDVAVYSFAFLAFARSLVPVRIAMALYLTPWVDENLVSRIKRDDDEDRPNGK